MTEPSTTPASDEELSAALDGGLDPDRLEQLRTDPANAARLEQLEAVATSVGTPVRPLDDQAIDQLITTALEPATSSVPTPSRRPRGPAPWMVAAAVTTLLAIGLTLVWTGRGVERQDRASSSADGASAAVEQSRSGDATPAAGDGQAGDLSLHGEAQDTAGTATTMADLAPPMDLGAFPDGDALRAALATTLPADEEVTASAEAPTDAAIERCATQLTVTLGLASGPSRVATARVADRSSLVYEFDSTSLRDGSPTTLVAAVGADACDAIVLFER